MIDPNEPLRPYQATDLSFYAKSPRSMILYEPRMGKTVTAVNACFDGGSKNILVICPLNAFYVWSDHFIEWYKFTNPTKTIQVVMVRGTKPQRDVLLLKPRTCDINVFVMVQATFIRDIESFLIPSKRYLWATFDTIIVDEFHKWLNSRTSKTFQYLAPLAREADRIHLLSGTPIDKGPHQFWPALHLCNPKYFSSYWKFADAFCVYNENNFGGKEYVGPQNLDELHRLLDRYARIRDRSETSMPKLSRSIIHVEQTKAQKKLHDQIDADDFAITPDGKLLVAPNSMEKYLRLRQILTCPAMFDEALGPGAALENLADQLEDMPEEHRHIVIFTSFRKALPIFADYLWQHHYKVETLYGGLEPQELDGRIRRFRANKGIIVCSSHYAQAFSLEPALACYHIGWDWSPNINKQAEDRLLSQSGAPVNSMYYIHRDSYVEERVAEVVISKHAIVQAIMKRDPK